MERGDPHRRGLGSAAHGEERRAKGLGRKDEAGPPRGKDGVPVNTRAKRCRVRFAGKKVDEFHGLWMFMVDIWS